MSLCTYKDNLLITVFRMSIFQLDFLSDTPQQNDERHQSNLANLTLEYHSVQYDTKRS